MRKQSSEKAQSALEEDLIFIFRWCFQCRESLFCVMLQQYLTADSHAADSSLWVCNMRESQSHTVRHHSLWLLQKSQSWQVLYDADQFSLCSLHISLQLLWLMLSRASDHYCLILWEIWCCCSACTCLWWQERQQYTVSLSFLISFHLFLLVWYNIMLYQLLYFLK